MALNLVELVSKELSGENAGKIASLLGESNSAVARGIGAAVTSIIAGFMNKASTEGGSLEMVNWIRGGGYDGKFLDRFGSLLSGEKGAGDLLASGASLLAGLFGTRLGAMETVVSSASGLARGSSRSLLGMAASCGLATLGKQLSTDSLDSVGLMDLLSSQKGVVQSSAPAGLAGALGIMSLSQLGGSPPPMPSGAPGSGMSFIRGLWPFIAAAFAFMLVMKACGDFGYRHVPPKPAAVPADTVKAVQAPVPAPVDTSAATADSLLGAFGEYVLPNGTKLNIPELGIERKLIAFIEDKTKAVDKETWFSFDRLTFDTGKATLQPSSQEQLNNIAEILKAYPVVELKVGGYTDNVGDPKANLKLSQARAETVMAEVVKLGIDQKRLTAEGYGDQHPVADNATEEGRQKNRRVDCRVARK
jgi:outer membrane protein OmpA-like peptidoglycan-associated protein